MTLLLRNWRVSRDYLEDLSRTVIEKTFDEDDDILSSLDPHSAELELIRHSFNHDSTDDAVGTETTNNNDKTSAMAKREED
eukprot:CAMPEP_0194144976 /NCGR_PEP_ID=MMETSP0152-20130528/13921_1 /TAXON_ID=1049557 /ORGANISM="Thalassiothrix antarctica, Strain L6-D1" /LENGTH=80 /DNA_ID=CAMNT_0038845001 /DNA_START=340 /DNA_END=582 /DNA_ORIENTATION=-